MAKTQILIILSFSIIALGGTGCYSNVQPRAYGTACVNNSLNPFSCSTTTSQYVTGIAGGAVIAPNGSPSLTIPLGFYTGGQSCVMSDTNLLSGNILSGVSVFGVAGALVFQNFTASSAFRTVGTSQITLAAEINQGTCSNNTFTTRASCEAVSAIWSPSALPVGYHVVPIIATDDEGSDPSSPVIPPTHPNPGDCGSTQKTIAARIANCSQSWNGSTQGNSSEGVWNLVSRINGYEVWQDQKTGLLWSADLDYGGASNWCWASGNHGPDPFGYCTNVANQDQVNPVSFCSEVDNTGAPLYSGNFISGNGTENFQTGSYDQAKGGMGKIPSSTSPSVLWRLPTTYDFQLAEVDGIRLVLPDYNINGSSFWSNAILSKGRDKTFYYGTLGETFAISRSVANFGIICVGR